MRPLESSSSQAKKNKMTGDDKHRIVGTVTSVSADKLQVELLSGLDGFTVVGSDDMQQIARLNSYVLIPVQTDYVVGEVVDIRQRDVTTDKQRDSEAGLPKADSVKFLDVVPLGMMDRKGEKFEFGVSNYPALYADVLYALDDDLRCLFNAKKTKEVDTVLIGHSASGANYETRVNTNKFFGGHLAVLGNTGSGKSCTVASILQSIFTRQEDPKAENATFIIFDVNGEYNKALNIEFPNAINVRPLKMDGNDKSGSFMLPMHLLNAEEWELILHASEKTQRPILRNALGLAALFASDDNSSDEGITYESEKTTNLKQHILASCIINILTKLDGSVPTAAGRVEGLLREYAIGDLSLDTCLDYPEGAKIEINSNTIKSALKVSYGEIAGAKQILDLMEKFIQKPAPELPDFRGADSKFTLEALEDALDIAILYEESFGNRQIRDYCATLFTRIKLLHQDEFKFLRSENPKKRRQILDEILGLKLGSTDTDDTSDDTSDVNCQIIILELDDVADEIVELVSAVLSRLIFDFTRKQEPRASRPVHLILEEAHRYVAQRPSEFAIDASRIFERIAKEGRKYGMFLMLASQRPSELSKTVLSQCANFIIHRIQNPDDLNHIRQMTPFISKNVLDRLPSLPQQFALIFGSAVNIHMTFKVRTANPVPKSEDSMIVKHWYPTTDVNGDGEGIS